MRAFLVVVLAAAVGAVGYYAVSKALRPGAPVAQAPSAPAADPAAAAGGSAAKDPGARAVLAGPDAAPAGGSASPGAELPGTSVTARMAPPAPGGTAPPAPAAKTRPIFYRGDSEGEDAPPAPPIAARLAPAPAAPDAPAPAVLPAAAPAAAPPAAPAAAESSGVAIARAAAPGIEADRRLAWTALETGDREGGLRTLRQIWAVSKDSSGVDITREVLVLLESEPSIDRKLEYVTYLARRDASGSIFEDRLAECRKKLAVADESPESALAAWDELTVAYVVGGSRVRRKQVVALLDPFIQAMVFSGRYTPLIASHTVREGDSLSTIAAKYGTTGSSIQRLNKLSSDVIQPRQRLRVLPGELKIFVDKKDFTLWTTVGGRVFLEFRVGLGRDNSTPVGTFIVRDRQKDPTWFRPGQPPLPPGDPGNVLGTRWLGFKDTPDYAGYGIHGTTDPSDIGTESSSGCVRLLMPDVELLFDFAGRGTAVEIRP